jgi:hypothetical protein
VFLAAQGVDHTNCHNHHGRLAIQQPTEVLLGQQLHPSAQHRPQGLQYMAVRAAVAATIAAAATAPDPVPHDLEHVSHDGQSAAVWSPQQRDQGELREPLGQQTASQQYQCQVSNTAIPVPGQ